MSNADKCRRRCLEGSCTSFELKMKISLKKMMGAITRTHHCLSHHNRSLPLPPLRPHREDDL